MARSVRRVALLEFLRHITRCGLLLFVVDMAGSEGRDPIVDVETLRTEIKLYDEDLSKEDWLVVANKMDLEGAEENLQICNLSTRACIPDVSCASTADCPSNAAEAHRKWMLCG